MILFFSVILSLFALLLVTATAYDIIVIQWLEKKFKEMNSYEVHLNEQNVRKRNLEHGRQAKS